MLKIIYEDDEYGAGTDVIGKVRFEEDISTEINGYDMLHSFIKVMQIMEFHPNTIKGAVEEILEELSEDENTATENEEKDL